MDPLYYIERFERLNINEQQLFFLPYGVFPANGIMNNDTIDKLHRMSGKVVEECDIQNSFGINNVSELPIAISESSLIRKLPDSFAKINQVAIHASNPHDLIELSESLSTDYKCSITLLSENEPTPFGTQMAIVYLDSYNEEAMNELWKNWPDTTAIIQSSYRLDRFLYLDNPYLPEIGNPNHWDNMRILKSKSSDVSEGSRDFFKMFEPELINSYPSMPLNKMEHGWVHFLIFRRIERLLGLTYNSFRVDEFSTSTTHDLLTGNSHSSIVPHHDTPTLPSF